MRWTNFLMLAAIAGATLPAAAAAPRADYGRYQSAGEGPVNSWWVETPHGQLILFDAQRDVASANALIAAVTATGKPVAAIFVTHPHPDHVTGLGLVSAAFPAAPVYASTATANELGADREGLIAIGLGAAPGALPAPHIARAFRDGESIAIDGVEVRAIALGDGEGVGMTAYYLPGPKLLIGGDLATEGLVPWLAEGRTGDWLGQLDQLKKRLPSGVQTLPGHGEPAALSRLSGWTASYLKAVRDAVGRARTAKSDGGDKVTPAERKTIVETIDRRFKTAQGVAGMPLEKLWKLNIDAVARELGGGMKGYLPEN